MPEQSPSSVAPTSFKTFCKLPLNLSPSLVGQTARPLFSDAVVMRTAANTVRNGRRIYRAWFQF